MERFRENPYPRLQEVDACVEEVLKHCSPSTETVALKDALFSVTAIDVLAPRNIPQAPTSIMDGFALRAQEKERVYTVTHDVHANKADQKELGDDEVMYITTGGLIPVGADAVVPVEDAQQIGNEQVQLPSAKRGQHIRQIGSDTKQGEVVLRKNCVLKSGDLGLLAACGIPSVQCYKKPKAAVISTGDELNEIDTAEAEEETKGIFDANRPLLKALIKEEHCEVVDYGIIADDKEKLRNTIIDAATNCDIVILSGGVSRGNKDYVKPLMEELGVVHFGSMNMKPGKPTTFSTIRGSSSLIFGLPGNPASCFVTFHLLIVPALRAMRGKTSSLSHPRVRLTITTPIQRDVSRPEYVRATAHFANGKIYANSSGFQRSSRVQSCAQSNCFILVPPQKAASGTTVEDKGCRCSAAPSSDPGNAFPEGTELDGYLFDALVDPPLLEGEVKDRAMAKVFLRVVNALQPKNDVSNDSMLAISGFDRRCLSRWLRKNYALCGVEKTEDDARIFGGAVHSSKVCASDAHEGGSPEKRRRHEGTANPIPQGPIDTRAQAATFRDLIDMFQERSDLQNKDVMALLGFCRNCISKWYKEALEDVGATLSIEQVKEEIYGMPYEDWKKLTRTEPTLPCSGHNHNGVVIPSVLTHRSNTAEEPLFTTAQCGGHASGPYAWTCGVLTVSDRAAEGVYEDKSGPAARKMIAEIGGKVTSHAIVKDDIDEIQQAVRSWAADGIHAIFTLGGTGFAPRDRTPEAITPLLTKQAPGIQFALLKGGLEYTSMAVLSRPVCGCIGSTFVCTLPGSVKGSVEGITILKDLIPHLVSLMRK